MSDQATNRPEEVPPHPLGKSLADSQLRLVTMEGNVVFPEQGDATDKSPTIISKTIPSDIGPAPSLSGSLRGRRLAHFELLEPIGVGGMAAVLRARDTQLERFVALKILPPEMAQDPENIRRFHQEARAAARLDHENIARVFFCGEDQRLHFIAFEYVEGDNLRVLLEKRGRLPVAEAVRIVLQIATGLEHAASRGVVHRDVKPSNIIISPNGRAKLVDMGLARSLEPRNDGALTQSGVTLGTFDYISPEQALEPREADSRSDIYSLGCTFYHMLTGQAPVPEGTAAKKLHHHQHIAPVDPRQINAEVPDEVAMVLGRMMAKDPKDRYQRPVDLVQHLLQVAQKVGAADDVPEGLLFFDAAMPNDPRKHPLLLISMGALALALVLTLLSLAPPPRQPNGQAATTPTDKQLPVKDSATNTQAKGNNSHVAKSDKRLIDTYDDLVQALADGSSNLNWILTSDIDIPEGKVFYGGDGNRVLKISSKYREEPKTIRFNYNKARANLDPSSNDLVAGLTFDGGIITFENVRLEIQATDTPSRAVGAVGIKNSTTVVFKNCRFDQLVPQRKFIPQMDELIPVASMAVANVSGDLDGRRPQITFDQCYFAGGQAAIGMEGPASVTTTNCAFMPYGALFHVRGDIADYGVTIHCDSCSALVMNGPAFRLDNQSKCELKVEDSIFSRPDGAPTEKCDEADLIRQTVAGEPLVKFEGKRNCYHNLNALWVRRIGQYPKLCIDMEEFRALIRQGKGAGDERSSLLNKDVAIWDLPAPWEKKSFNKYVFSLRKDVREVRRADGRALGFEKCVDVTMDALPPWPTEEVKIAQVKLEASDKVFDPEWPENGPQKFNSLFKAMAQAESGDRILIKHGKNPELQVDPMQLKVDVTLQPYPGYHPILTMARTQEADAAFFRMAGGKLTLDKLEFLLREPDQANFRAQAVVSMSGNASCDIRNCLITMQPSEKVAHDKHRAALSLVTLADPEEVMKMPGSAPPPVAEIRIRNCYIRGEGEVVTVRASRPLDLGADNCLIALAGSLLEVQAGLKDGVSETEGSIKLNRVSAFLTEPMLVFRSGNRPKGFVLTRANSITDCLFVGLSNKPLVLVESPDMTEDTLRSSFDWVGEHNAFANVAKLLAIVRAGDDLPFLDMNYKRWGASYKEIDSLASPISFPSIPLGSFWTAELRVFAPTDELTGYGADFDSLPKLAPAKKAISPE